METIEDYIRGSRKLTLDAFVKLYGHPVLMRWSDAGERQGTDVFGTVDVRLGERMPTGNRPSPEAAVISVVKRSNLFSDMITCGRAKNNDVVLPESGISKFHAWITAEPKDGKWAVADGSSRNGTFLNGKRLSPDEPVPLNDGDKISLSPRSEFIFYTPGGFFDMLRRWF